jgi:hypothetical protein
MWQVWLIKVSVDRLQYEFEQLCDSTGEDPYCSRFASSVYICYFPLPLFYFRRCLQEQGSVSHRSSCLIVEIE